MTRKDYVALAAALKTARQKISDTETFQRGGDMLDAVSLAAEYIADDVLARENPRFDRARFLTACGVQS